MVLVESLGRLKSITDAIVAYFDERRDLDEVGRAVSAWYAREAHSIMAAACEFLRLDQRPAAEHFLEFAQERFEGAARVLGADDRSKGLSVRFRESFQSWRNEFSLELSRIGPVRRTLETAVVRVSEQEFYLLCHECGKVAAWFKIAFDNSSPKKLLCYTGTCMSTSLPLTEAADVFSLLDRGDLSALDHHLLNFLTFSEGLDPWCPSCEHIYCAADYHIEVFFDDGSYDASWGTCPRGHRRKLDD